MDKTEELMQNRTLNYFSRLCQIPRESHNEKAVSDFIVDWAVSLGLEVKQDEFLNVYIKKPGTAGREGEEPILFQAHLDMVCEKESDSSHDFKTDPIKWRIDGDWILSADHTSLGADCGIGVAHIMEILSSRDISHPPIEVLLTTREETDMMGAKGFDISFFSAKRMINLDISPDNRMLAGSCGGIAIEMRIPVSYGFGETQGWTPYQMKVKRLTGGHSGADIHKGRENAIQIMARLLVSLSESMEIRLASLLGGNSRLAIPSESDAVIYVSENCEIGQKTHEFYMNMLEECAPEDSELEITVCECPQFDQPPFSAETKAKILSACLLIPNGIQQMSSTKPGCVESSSNLGVVHQDGEDMLFISEARSTYESTRELLVEKQKVLAGILGGKVITHSDYPAWIYRKDSALRDMVYHIYESRENKGMEVVTVHAGNELGIIVSKLGLTDAVALGPTREYFHTPRECLSISSVLKFESFLHEILQKL